MAPGKTKNRNACELGWPWLLSLLLGAALFAPSLTALAQEPAGQEPFVYKVDAELVLVSVTVRDRQGNLVRGLQSGDFTVLEDGKAQHVASFDVEDIE